MLRVLYGPQCMNIPRWSSLKAEMRADLASVMSTGAPHDGAVATAAEFDSVFIWIDCIQYSVEMEVLHRSKMCPTRGRQHFRCSCHSEQAKNPGAKHSSVQLAPAPSRTLVLCQSTEPFGGVHPERSRMVSRYTPSKANFERLGPLESSVREGCRLVNLDERFLDFARNDERGRRDGWGSGGKYLLTSH